MVAIVLSTENEVYVSYYKSLVTDASHLKTHSGCLTPRTIMGSAQRERTRLPSSCILVMPLLYFFVVKYFEGIYYKV